MNTENFLRCHSSCSTCYKEYENNITNCLQCNADNGYYPLYNDNSTCYHNETIINGYYLDKSAYPFIWKQCFEKCETCNIFYIPNKDCENACPNGTYKYLLNNSCIKLCPDDYIIYNDECIKRENEQKAIISEYKNKIFSNITSYINSTKVINGTNFIAAVFSSDNMNPEEQIKNGISAIDLGNCTQKIKEYYNISKYESLIIFNIETKSESYNNSDNSFILGKNTQIEIYDKSRRKLELSVCKEDIKVM